MTTEQLVQCVDVWRLPMLENIIMQLEDSFGAEIEKYKIKNDYNNVQLRSYAHGILVMKEILCLLKSGFPDGALARARRMYEQMIILLYMEIHKNDSDFEKMVDKYFDDHNIRAYFNQIEWLAQSKYEAQKQSCEQALHTIIQKYAPVGSEEKKLKSIMVNSYWWSGETSFNKLSSCLNDPFAQILYRRACFSIHASAMGDFALLGRDNSEGENVYTGVTYSGFEAPLLLSLVSFNHMTDIVFENFHISKPLISKNINDLLEFYMSILFDKNKTDEV